MQEKKELTTFAKDFAPVIGYDAIKKELERYCDIMRNEDVYVKLGAKVPSGILLHGEPGLGKTLMAKCFIKASGRKHFICRKDKPDGDFVKYITDVFNKAKESAPSIVFLDDMDKFANADDFHSDYEEFVTIQSMIDEVKGKGVFVLATANSTKCFPRSLLRPGRFDSIIRVESPKGEEAEKIISHYIANKKFVKDVNVKTVSRLLDGGSCAELETVINEAAVYAGYERREKITTDDLVKAAMRVLHRSPEALDKRNMESAKRIAYHEAGHAVVAEVLKEGSVNFVSIRPYHGNVGGFTSYCQGDDYWLGIEPMQNRVVALFGGKAATEIKYGEVDVGASSDINRAQDIVYRFIAKYAQKGFDSIERGMEFEMTREQSERISSAMNSELSTYYEKAKKIIANNVEFLDKLVSVLLEKEVLTGEDITAVKNSSTIRY